MGIQRSQLSQAELGAATPQQAQQQERVNLQLQKSMPAFGFDNLVADWAFLNFLQYYGDDAARKATGYALAPEYFDIIVKRDPRFVETYMFLSNAVSFQLGQPQRATALMQQAASSIRPQDHPNAFVVWRYTGLDKLLLEGDIPGAIAAFDNAAHWVKASPNADLEPVFKGTADFLRKDPNSRQARVQAWADVFLNAAQAGDKTTQARASQELGKLGFEVIQTQGKFQLQPIAGKPVPSPAASPSPAPTPSSTP
jgi:tetratricopeptide (TPR) repeat protein